jgi:hypothetical protein
MVRMTTLERVFFISDPPRSFILSLILSRPAEAHAAHLDALAAEVERAMSNEEASASPGLSALLVPKFSRTDPSPG